MPQNGLLTQLIDALRCLPGIGGKSAQRMAFFLLQGERKAAIRLQEILTEALQNMRNCRDCRIYTENVVCEHCSNPGRDETVLCVVEHPSDVWVIEQAGFFKGRYFVLHGRLSPLDGVGPEQLGMDMLLERLQQGILQEVILATNSTVEGEATANFIADLACSHKVRATRIAHGVPMGGELEFIDSGTLNHAFQGRKAYD